MRVEVEAQRDFFGLELFLEMPHAPSSPDSRARPLRSRPMALLGGMGVSGLEVRREDEVLGKEPGAWRCLELCTCLGSELGAASVEGAVEESSPPRRRAKAAASGVMYCSPPFASS